MGSVDAEALHTTGEPGAAVSAFQQWAERWVGIRESRAIGGGNDARHGSWVKTIAVRLWMLPEGTNACPTPAHASGHSVKTYECERERLHGSIRRVEQPSRQRVCGFQVQRLPGLAFSLVQMLSGTVNYRGTLAPPRPHYFTR